MPDELTPPSAPGNAARVYHTLVIGSGFSGLCMAIRLLQGGQRDILLLEKSDDVGGTWRDNHYPGAECDVPSALYSYSFERKTDWDYQWSGQGQILEYIHHVVQRHGLRRYIRFGSAVIAAHFDEQASLWQVTLDNGDTLRSRFLVSAVGQLHQPSVPKLPGQEDFAGPQFHSARWDDKAGLRGKSVAVIGNAASAVQFVPAIAGEVASLTVYQRSANWLAPKRDRPYTAREKKLMRALPWIKSLARLKTYLRNELIVYPALRGRRLNAWLLRQACLGYMKKTIADETLRAKLTPDYPIGAKRILTANGYYEALCRDNVELVTEPIRKLDARGIITADDVHREHDVVIYATGFITNPFLHGIEVRGRGDRLLAQHWCDGAHAYLGVTTRGFPNLFFLYGPNTNLGHNSILLMSEAEVDYILRLMATAQARDAASVEVREHVEGNYNRALQKRLARMAWSRIEDSWYKSGERVTNNWPGSVGEYRQRLRNYDPDDFAFD